MVRDVTDLVVSAAGGVVPGDATVGVRLVDAAGVEVVSVSAFLRDLRAWDRSCGSLRSYALALLRWFRFLWAVEVDWDRVTRWEVTEFVLFLQQTREVRPSRVASGPAAGSVNPVTRKRYLPEGYQPRTINHNLSVLRVFYDFHVDAGTGPLVNPVPVARRRDGQRVHSHHNPMEPFAPHRRAPVRQRIPAGSPRSLPDGLFDKLFAAMTCDRDRAALAFYISSGARASELLGVSCDRLDVGEQRIGVVRRGSGVLQWLPASSDAFVWLRLYQERLADDVPRGPSAPLWWTRRRPWRPLTYAAMRAVLQRANAALATNWTLHDLRHTAAYRMARDPRLSLADVQWVLGHAHLSTTQIYTKPREEDVVERLREFHLGAAARAAAPSPLAAGYRPESVAALLGRLPR